MKKRTSKFTFQVGDVFVEFSLLIGRDKLSQVVNLYLSKSTNRVSNLKKGILREEVKVFGSNQRKSRSQLSTREPRPLLSIPLHHVEELYYLIYGSSQQKKRITDETCHLLRNGAYILGNDCCFVNRQVCPAHFLAATQSCYSYPEFIFYYSLRKCLYFYLIS